MDPDSYTQYSNDLLTLFGTVLTRLSYPSGEKTGKRELVASLAKEFQTEPTGYRFNSSICNPVAIRRYGADWHTGEQAHDNAGKELEDGDSAFWTGKSLRTDIWVLHPRNTLAESLWNKDKVNLSDTNEEGLAEAMKQAINELVKEKADLEKLKKAIYCSADAATNS